MSNWINVKESLPDYDTTVLVWAKDGIAGQYKHHFASRYGINNCAWLPWNLEGIEWWAPLPEPPEADDE